MKVMLVPPTYRYSLEYPAFLSLSDFPSAYGYLASALKNAGHTVTGFNPNNLPGYVDAPTMLRTTLTKALQEHKPELVGMGGLCTDYKFFKDAIAIIRQVSPETKIVLGGQIVNNDAEDVFKLLKPDFAVVGDGEQAIVEIANGNKPAGIVSIPPLDVNELPLPDYEPFGISDMIDNYSGATRLLYRFSRENPRPYGIVTARGCPFSCSFCVDHHRSYRPRSMSKIMEEIKVSYEKYHYNILIILDELFAVNKERMQEFCREIICNKAKYGWDFDWMFQTHASAKLDLTTLELAKEAGCVSFSYGLESASPTVLASMHKKIDPMGVVEAIKLAQEAKVGFSANLIFGDIAETRETITESLCFWMKYTPDAFVFLGTVVPYPGSELFESARKKGMFKDKKEYYEHAHEINVNLTSMPDREWIQFQNVIRALESSWAFAKTATMTKVEPVNSDDKYIKQIGGFYFRITTICPHCEKEINYVERLIDANQQFWVGTGCPQCQKRIKVVRS